MTSIPEMTASYWFRLIYYPVRDVSPLSFSRLSLSSACHAYIFPSVSLFPSLSCHHPLKAPLVFLSQTVVTGQMWLQCQFCPTEAHWLFGPFLHHRLLSHFRPSCLINFLCPPSFYSHFCPSLANFCIFFYFIVFVDSLASLACVSPTTRGHS